MTTAVQQPIRTFGDFMDATVGYGPNASQRPISESKARVILVSGGIGAGKSLVLARLMVQLHLLAVALVGKKAGEDEVRRVMGPYLAAWVMGRMARKKVGWEYWLVGASYTQTKPEYDYLVEMFGKIPWNDRVPLLRAATKGVDPGHIELMDGAHIWTKSLEDPMKIAGADVDGVALCEAGQNPWEAFTRTGERLRTSRGFQLLSGTMERTKYPWFPKLLQAWRYGAEEGYRAFVLPTWSNTAVYPKGYDDPWIQEQVRIHSEEYVRERLGGEPMPPSNLVIPEFTEKIHVRPVEWAGGDVYISNDPGFGGHYSYHANALEAIQVVDGQVQVFDEIYVRDKLTEDVITMAMRRPWWRRVRKLTVDPYKKTQHQSTSSVGEIWMAKTGLHAYGERFDSAAGRERLKTFLKVDGITGKPGLVVSPKCQGLLSEFGVVPNPFTLGEYGGGEMHPWVWKEDKDGEPQGIEPDTKFCDGIKAVIYFLVEEFGYATPEFRRREPRKAVRYA